MPDIFGRTDQFHGGGLSADHMFLTFPALTNNGLGLLVQNLQLQYRQPVRRVFEIGPGVRGRQPSYYITGRPEGNFSLGRIFGPDTLLDAAFYSNYGNPCTPTGDVSLIGSAGCNGQPFTEQRWTIRGFLVTDYGMAITAQEMAIQEQCAGMFVGLNIDADPLFMI